MDGVEVGERGRKGSVKYTQDAQVIGLLRQAWIQSHLSRYTSQQVCVERGTRHTFDFWNFKSTSVTTPVMSKPTTSAEDRLAREVLDV
jgi:hypothetical protein